MTAAMFCTYCHIERATDYEHVFPKSWYPDNTPGAVQRLTVPSCRACNQRWQQIEETVGHDLLMICDAEHPDATGVVERIIKGWDASRAKNERDARHREGRARRILKTIRWEKAHEEAPQVEAKLADGTSVRLSPAREIDSRALNALAEKFIRGLHYGEGQGEVPLDRIVRAFIVPTEKVKMVAQATPFVLPEILVQGIARLPVKDQLRPGLVYRWASTEAGSIWSFRLWGHVDILAACDAPRVVLAR